MSITLAHKTNTNMTIEDTRIIESMQTHGGAFVKALAEAMRLADPYNMTQIKDAFPDLMTAYSNLAAPDAAKLQAFAATVRGIKPPKLSAFTMLDAQIAQRIEEFAKWIEAQADNL